METERGFNPEQEASDGEIARRVVDSIDQGLGLAQQHGVTESINNALAPWGRKLREGAESAITGALREHKGVAGNTDDEASLRKTLASVVQEQIERVGADGN